MTSSRLRLGLAMCVVVAAVASCKDATSPVVPTNVVPATGSITFSALGQTHALGAVVLDQRGTTIAGALPNWSSSSASVATVDSAGVVTAVGNGTATITAAAGNAAAQVTVSVAQIAATLVLNGTASFSALGDTLRLASTVRDSGGSAISGAGIAWSVIDTLVARVAADGLVTAVGSGTTRLFAIAGGALGSATVTVTQSPDALDLSADSVSLSALGDTVRITAEVRDPGGSVAPQAQVAWVSSDTSVARVSAAGLVTAVANGAAVVSATSGAAVDTTRVTVSQIAASLQLLPDSVVLKDPGDTLRVTLTARDSRGVSIASPSVTWMSADGGVASVDSTGLVTAQATGTVSVSADVDGTAGAVSVRVQPEVTLVAAGPTVLSGSVASQLSLSVRVQDLLGSGYAGASIAWSTGPGSGAITSGDTTSSGPTGHSGAVWLLGTVAGPQQATATIESRGSVVQVAFAASAAAGPAVSAALLADSIVMHGIGETAFLGPTYADQYGNSATAGGLTLVSRDPLVATVAPGGLVTAAGADSTYVVLSVSGTPTDSLLVTVSLRGAITVTFDDGFIDADTLAFPVMQALGLRGNVAVNPAQVGFSAYIPKSGLDAMHAAGWSIVSHTMRHPQMDTLSEGELDYELRASQQWIDAQGYNGSNVFIVPYHTWGARERDAIGTYYEAARGTSATQVFPDTVLVSWRPSNPYDLTGFEADEFPYTTPVGRDALRDVLQRTVDEGAFIDLFFHGLNNNLAEFQATMDVVNEFRERVLPYHELYPRFARGVF